MESSENALECNCVKEVKKAEENETESTHNQFQSSEEALINAAYTATGKKQTTTKNLAVLRTWTV